jgi:3-deoxy-D-arabino-heptulosonate 7-phosphate (DAHP) synthase
MVEVHDHPEKALSDGAQALLPEQFELLMEEARQLAPVLGRALEAVAPAGS